VSSFVCLHEAKFKKKYYLLPFHMFVNGYNAIHNYGLFTFAWKLNTGCLKLHPLEITITVPNIFR
jgi:hypothetical protein